MRKPHALARPRARAASRLDFKHRGVPTQKWDKQLNGKVYSDTNLSIRSTFDPRLRSLT